MSTAGIIAALIGVGAAASAVWSALRPSHVGPAPDSLVIVPASDEVMQKAYEDARASLHIFLATRDATGNRDESFMVKVGQPAGGGGLEHIWVDVLGVENGQFTGRLSNEPFDIPGYHRGDEVVFAESEIEDWSFERDGKAYGQFTTRAMLDHAPPNDAQDMLRSLWPNPIPEKH